MEKIKFADFFLEQTYKSYQCKIEDLIYKYVCQPNKNKLYEDFGVGISDLMGIGEGEWAYIDCYEPYKRFLNSRFNSEVRIYDAIVEEAYDLVKYKLKDLCDNYYKKTNNTFIFDTYKENAIEICMDKYEYDNLCETLAEKIIENFGRDIFATSDMYYNFIEIPIQKAVAAKLGVSFDSSYDDLISILAENIWNEENLKQVWEENYRVAYRYSEEEDDEE